MSRIETNGAEESFKEAQERREREFKSKLEAMIHCCYTDIYGASSAGKFSTIYDCHLKNCEPDLRPRYRREMIKALKKKGYSARFILVHFKKIKSEYSFQDDDVDLCFNDHIHVSWRKKPNKGEIKAKNKKSVFRFFSKVK